MVCNVVEVGTVVVVGFDEGDPVFDSRPGSARLERWLVGHLVAPAAARGVEASFSLLAVANPLKKPGPVFNAMAAHVARAEVVEGRLRVRGVRTVATSLAEGKKRFEADFLYR